LLNHPLDCPVCDQAGECHLQDLGYEHGKMDTRYEFRRREFEKIDIGDNIQLHMNRCIMCWRCVKVAEQLTDGRVHGVMNRGEHAEISTYIEAAIENDFSGNVIDVCPVGALTDKTFRFKSRVWFTKPVDAHRDCGIENCSGHVRLWFKGDEVLRVTARKDEYGEVADSTDGKAGWICNDCRFHKKDLTDWVIEGPAKINRHSVISANHYEDGVNGLKLIQFDTRMALARANHEVEPYLSGVKHGLGSGPLNPNNQ
jgi:NADH-quinone oxidoreductase subunit G